jgi:hypothetical protein
MAAERTLSAEFERQRITSDDEKGNFVRYLLGDADDILSKQRPFLWKSAYDPCEDTESPDPNRLQVCYVTHIGICLLITYFLGIVPRASGYGNIS